jgi:hypothetical protein
MTPVAQPGGGCQFTVLTRGYRTNLIEVSTNLALSSAWQTVGTNITTNSTFTFTRTNAAPNQFYRVRRP